MRLPARELYLHHLATDAWHGPSGVQQCQRFHQGKGWRDIAYTFLVDVDGAVFEGHGIGVLGTHTRGRNSISAAICAMSDFTRVKPSERMLASIAELVVHGHRSGWWPDRLTGGHRDAPGAQTSCPGDRLYRELPGLNRRVHALLTLPEDDIMARTCIPTSAVRMPNSRFPFFRLTEDLQLVLGYNGAQLKRVDGRVYGVPFMKLGTLNSPPVGICEAPGGAVVVVCGDGGTIDVAA